MGLDWLPAADKAALLRLDMKDIACSSQTGVTGDIVIHRDSLYLVMNDNDGLMQCMLIDAIADTIAATLDDQAKGKGSCKSSKGKGGSDKQKKGKQKGKDPQKKKGPSTKADHRTTPKGKGKAHPQQDYSKSRFRFTGDVNG